MVLTLSGIHQKRHYVYHSQAFKSFVCDILSRKTEENEKFYKTSMNCSYGLNEMNTEKFVKIKLCDEGQIHTSNIFGSFCRGYTINNELYDKLIYTFMPDLSINTFKDMKKSLCNYIEKHRQNQIASSPKSYMIWNNDSLAVSLKFNGISKRTNHLVSSDYSKVINEGTVVKGTSTSLQIYDHVMYNVTMSKNALTGLNNKLIILPN